MSGRRRAESKSAKASALEELRNLRRAGKSRVDTFEIKEDSVYDEVDETEYLNRVKKRREESSFVVNDDKSLGYHDDGEEIFDHYQENSEEEMVEEEIEGPSKDGKKGKGGGALSFESLKRVRQRHRERLGGKGEQKLTSLFMKQANAQTVAPQSFKRSKVTSNVADDLDLDSMISSLDAEKSAPSGRHPAVPRPRSDPSSRPMKSSSFPARRKEFGRPQPPPVAYDDEPMDDYDGFTAAGNDWDGTDENAAPAEQHQDGEGVSGPPLNPFSDPAKPASPKKTDTVLGKRPSPNGFAKEDESRGRTVKVEGVDEVKRTLDMEAPAAEGVKKEDKDSGRTAAPVLTAQDLMDMTSAEHGRGEPSWMAIAQPSAPSGDHQRDSGLYIQTDEDGSEYLSVFWIDAYEQQGKLFLFGKVATDNTATQFRSICVVVDNVPRVLFALPRKEAASAEDLMPVYEEINSIFVPRIVPHEQGVRLKGKAVTRNYAFEVPDVPRRETKYLKFEYAGKFPPPPTSLCEEGGKTFSKIFGSSSSLLESFILKKKLMGPCWLKVKPTSKGNTGVCWCKYEAHVQSPELISLLKDAPPPPPLSVMSLALKTVNNPKDNTHEVVAISVMTVAKVSITGSTPDVDRHLEHFTVVRPLGSSKLPPDLKQQFPAGKTHVETVPNERALLNYFISKLHREDPDVLVGHNLHDYDLDVLMSRLSAHNIPQWSKLGRLNRSKKPGSKHGIAKDSFFGIIASGRLLCDVLVSSRELLPSQTDYSLTRLCETQLGRPKKKRIEPADVPMLYQSKKGIAHLCMQNLDDAYNILQLMFKLEVLPLTHQLTALCGNLWARSLKSMRAERIEYLLMHEFRARKFIIPDKRQKTENDGKKAKRKPEYSGGKVFEPKRGLYDTFVLLLDFNSLYPSIIREYNICFTTVERKLMANEKDEHEEEDEEGQEAEAASGGPVDSCPELPSSANEKGVLPDVLGRLLTRRAEVKKIMKSERDVSKLQQLDIRQKAIKLTANSMYGCLGFKGSRFYAKPIAQLVTKTGRQTLERAKELAERVHGLEVVYGDTDSLMIDSKTTDLAEAKKIARAVKVDCNKMYKLLELEVDGIFKTLLLLRKKKYAALLLQEIDGKVSYKREAKGLDLVRRDWCVLSREVGEFILDQILSGKNKDEVVDAIHSHLIEVAENIRKGAYPLEKFVITKGLNKHPKDYPDSKAQAHVHVALQMLKEGKAVSIGDHIPFVVCADPAQPSANLRARHVEEVQRAGGALQIDVEWYIENQIFPPISRLCEPIEGTSNAQLASSLGLDTQKFKASSTPSTDEVDIGLIPTTQLDDSERFKDCKPLTIMCTACRSMQEFPGVFNFQSAEGGEGPTAENGGSSGLFCPNPACRAEYWGAGSAASSTNSLSNKISLNLREHIKKYYEGWTVCDDPSCQNRTRQLSVAGDRCLAPNCRGQVRFQYSDRQLYNQLKYFETLFDVEREMNKIVKENKAKGGPSGNKRPPTLSIDHSQVFEALLSHVQHFISRSAYNWVRPSIWSTVFSLSPSAVGQAK